MIYWIGFIFFKVLSALCFPFKIIHPENIPHQGSFIYASNHASNLDPLVLGLTVWRRFSYMGKSTLFKNKILSFFLYQVGTFPVRRGEPDVGALREALRRLKSGCPLVVFPQGTRTALGQEGDSQRGVGFIVVKSGAPVVPVYLCGTDKVLPPKARWFRRHPINVIVGEPILFPKNADFDEVANKVMAKIVALRPPCFSPG